MVNFLKTYEAAIKFFFIINFLGFFILVAALLAQNIMAAMVPLLILFILDILSIINIVRCEGNIWL